jgi:tetratricopeptide (TPR) repeat protein
VEPDTASEGRLHEATDGPSRAAHAERQRRRGDAESALALAREALALDPGDTAALATAALALLDRGRDADLRRTLEAFVALPAAAEPEAPLGVLDEGEIERAFADAAPEREAMPDASDVALEAMRAAALDGPELGDPVAPESPFHTRTMAALLERQGDAAAARAIRASLSGLSLREDEPAPPVGRLREDAIRTLERWLERLRRGTA